MCLILFEIGVGVVKFFLIRFKLDLFKNDDFALVKFV